ncbi:ORF119, gene family 8 [White spot syndrome virus]|uniref:ORF119, gene family 8 n=1 Tax=White spot syndrome virus TaxID=342409 RepID=Q91LC6_9VIRU|nr:ORF119, gene family 8 [White spot syndrome virus]BDX27048.1 MAG: envelope protein VP52A [White spot syndrome virus]
MFVISIATSLVLFFFLLFVSITILDGAKTIDSQPFRKRRKRKRYRTSESGDGIDGGTGTTNGGGGGGGEGGGGGTNGNGTGTTNGGGGGGEGGGGGTNGNGSGTTNGGGGGGEGGGGGTNGGGNGNGNGNGGDTDTDDFEPTPALLKERLLNSISSKPKEYYEAFVSAEVETALQLSRDDSTQTIIIDDDQLELDASDTLQGKPRDYLFKLAGVSSAFLEGTTIRKAEDRARNINEEEIAQTILSQLREKHINDEYDGKYATPEERADFSNSLNLVTKYTNHEVGLLVGETIEKAFPHEIEFERCIILVEDFNSGTITSNTMQYRSNAYKIRVVEGSTTDPGEVVPDDCLVFAVVVNKEQHSLEISATNRCQDICFVIIPRLSAIGKNATMVIRKGDEIKQETYLFVANKNDTTHFSIITDKDESVGIELNMLIFSERILPTLSDPATVPRPLTDANVLSAYGKRLGVGAFTDKNLLSSQ